MVYNMLKSKKFWIAVILLIATNIGTAVGCMWVAEGITARQAWILPSRKFITISSFFCKKSTLKAGFHTGIL